MYGPVFGLSGKVGTVLGISTGECWRLGMVGC